MNREKTIGHSYMEPRCRVVALSSQSRICNPASGNFEKVIDESDEEDW